MSGSRIFAIIIVGLIHVVIGYTLVTGLAYSAVKSVVERVTTVDIEEPEPEPSEEPPPPPEPDTAPPPPVAPPPPINIAPAPPPIVTQPRIPPPAPPARIIPPPAPAAPPPAPPPPPSQARAAQRDGFNRWAARIQEAYPSRAIRREIEGNVGVAVTINGEGRVTSCRVTASSGESVLDEAACEGMERYARYDPALDAAGNPTSGSDSLTIVYRLS
ncbi:energy transducer TonB [Aurantiacibacter suaedae]|uniref:energy transducer TonB n=1 Tax=Aurantiacibacter suaedae TaxID=2545755 RepID=UPI001F4F9EEF|nr:energy transducer TonB [Aurantiacibacter suaedae]